ncbi:hypothetical protein ACFS32_22295 [Novosphingobium pokkalii]|uniref:hypothetical protein n=1 Tax=Novosphingobium pokkalii TaxID=1770194 RepID=UPI003637ED85
MAGAGQRGVDGGVVVKRHRAGAAGALHPPALRAQGLRQHLRGIAHAEDEQVGGVALFVGHALRGASTTPNPPLKRRGLSFLAIIPGFGFAQLPLGLRLPKFGP